MRACRPEARFAYRGSGRKQRQTRFSTAGQHSAMLVYTVGRSYLPESGPLSPRMPRQTFGWKASSSAPDANTKMVTSSCWRIEGPTRTVVQWDMGAALSADVGEDEVNVSAVC
jgi:hypothetical protein